MLKFLFFPKKTNYIKRAIQLFALFIAIASPSQAGIFDSHGHIKQPVVDVFRTCSSLIKEKKNKIPLEESVIENILNPETSIYQIKLPALNAIAQAVFLRPDNTERYQLENKYHDYLTKDDLKSLNMLFEKIGDRQDCMPPHNDCIYLLVNGSTIQNMRNRLNTVKELIEKGHIKPNEKTTIVFLTGERDLFPQENEEVLNDTSTLGKNSNWKRPNILPKNESDAAEWIWNQADLPEFIRNIPTVFVRAPKKEVLNKETNTIALVRPSTTDTVKQWIKTFNPQPGMCVSISTQPFVHYQKISIELVFRQLKINNQFTVDGAGFNKFSDEEFEKSLGVFLDNLARVIYTTLEIEKLIKK